MIFWIGNVIYITFFFQTPLSLSSFETPHQPKEFKFPKRAFGKDKIRFRQFQPQWFEKYRWLHYSEEDDKAYCHPCAVAYEKKNDNNWNCRTNVHIIWIYKLE